MSTKIKITPLLSKGNASKTEVPKVAISAKVKTPIKPKVTTTTIMAPSVPLTIQTLPITFQWMFHVSDVHIRPLQRHEEYGLVFKELYDSLASRSELNDSCIVVTGDLFDSKTTFRPETFKVGRDFLKHLSSLAPVILIPGNHDMNEANVTRLDSLTPLVDDLPNVHYLRDSGVYRCLNDIDFVVSSLYDKRFIFSNELQETSFYDPQRRLVALYHGTLGGSTTDTGQVLGDLDIDATMGNGAGSNGNGNSNSNSNSSSRYRSLADFEGYHAVLLGDIHKQQGWTTAGGHHVAYAGSLVQQNHGETRHGHGYLLWNTTSLSWQHVEIANKYGFVDIICHDGLWINRDIELPSETYARFIIKNCTETQLETIRTDLRSKVNSLTITKQQCVNENLQQEEIPPEVQRKTDEATIIREYCVREGYDVNAIALLHEEYSKTVERRDNTLCTAVWRPVWIEFKNMFGYGGSKNNRIVFRTGVTTITAGNTFGKSSIVNVLLFALFGRLPLNASRSYTSDIVNAAASAAGEQASVQLLLFYGGTYYIIERKTVKQKKGTGAAVAAGGGSNNNNYEFSASVWESNLKGERLKNCVDGKTNNTDSFLQGLIGELNDFSLTNFLHKDAKDLLSLTPAEQMTALKSLFDISIYDEYAKLNKVAQKELKSKTTAAQSSVKTLESMSDKSLPTDEHLKEERLNLLTLEEEHKTLQERAQTLSTEEQGYSIELQTLLHAQKGSLMVSSPSLTREEIQEELADMPTDLKDTGVTRALFQYKITQVAKSLQNTPVQPAVSKEATVAALAELPDLPPKLPSLKEPVLQRQAAELNVRLEATQKKLALLSDDTDPVTTAEPEKLQMQLNELHRGLVQLTSNKEAVEKRLAAINNILDVTDVSVEDAKNEIANLKKKLRPAVRSTVLSSAYEGPVTEEEIQRLELLVKPIGISKQHTGVDSNVLSAATAALGAIVDKITKACEDNPIEHIQQYVTVLNEAPMIDDEIKEAYSLNKGDDYCIVEEAVATSIATHLQDVEKHASAIKALQRLYQDRKLAEDKVALIERQLSENQTLEQNQTCQNDINTVITLLNKKVSEQIKTLEGTLQLVEEHERLASDLEKHLANMETRAAIDVLSVQLERLTLGTQVVTLSTELEQVENSLKVYQQVKEREKLTQIITSWQQYEVALEAQQVARDELTSLEQDLEQQEVYDRYIYLQGLLDAHDSYETASQRTKKATTLQQTLKEVREELRLATQAVLVSTKEMQERSKQLDLLSYKVSQQRELTDKLEKQKAECIELELRAKLLDNYGTLMGTHGIVSELLTAKVIAIQDYINTILQAFTKYSIVVQYDNEKQSLTIIATDTATRHALSVIRLSGYERLMLQIAFKRALNKFSYRSKSSIMIIDEALEVIDQSKFQDALPTIINMITQDYAICLAISQRDISHIGDHVVTISRDSGYSMLV